ncbi:MAG: GDSL-type esterase/lipase family protein [Candidatus Thiodiazotropha endolucinida]
MKHPIPLYLALLVFSIATYAGPVLSDKASDQPGSQQIVMIGASYLQGWPLNKVACLPVVNKGISGETSTQVRGRFESDAISNNPAAVIIWGHINDFSNAPMELEAQTRQTAIENLKYMIDRTKEAGIIPIIATEVTFGMPSDIKTSVMQFIGKIMGKRSFQDYISSNVLAVNDWIRNYANEQGVSVLEIERLMTDSEGNRKEGYYTEDLSHITKLAYQDLQAFAQPFLQQALIEKHGLCN